MSQSFIKINTDTSNGFWINDNEWAAICTFLSQIIDNYIEKEVWLSEMNILIKENSYGAFPSMMHIDIYKYITSLTRKMQFLVIINQSKKIIVSKGDYINKEELNNYIKYNINLGIWLEDPDSIYFIEGLDKLKNLIENIDFDSV